MPLVASAVCAMLNPTLTTDAGPGQHLVTEDTGVVSTIYRSSYAQRTAIVGNGPIAEGQRSQIDAADVVIRFNSMHSW